MKKGFSIIFNGIKTLAIRPNASDKDIADRSFWGINFILLFPLLFLCNLLKATSTIEIETSGVIIIWLSISVANYFVLMYDDKWVSILKKTSWPANE